MTKYERALQLWSVLALAATNKQILTYDIISKLVGVPRPALGQSLELIQQICQKKNIPPLTALVVSEETGRPGHGFTASTDVPLAQMQVFKFDWLTFTAPNIESITTTLES